MLNLCQGRGNVCRKNDWGKKKQEKSNKAILTQIIFHTHIPSKLMGGNCTVYTLTHVIQSA